MFIHRKETITRNITITSSHYSYGNGDYRGTISLYDTYGYQNTVISDVKITKGVFSILDPLPQYTIRNSSGHNLYQGQYIIWTYSGKITATSPGLYNTQFTITFTAEYNIVVPEQKLPEGMRVDIGYNTFGANYIDEVSVTQQQLSSVEQISTGVVSGYGNVSLIDRDNSIYSKVMNGSIVSNGQQVTPYYNGKKLGVFVVESSAYDRNTRKLDIRLTDKLAHWDDISFVDEIHYNNLYEVLENVLTNKAVGYGTDEVTAACSTMVAMYNVPDKVVTVKELLQSIKYSAPQTFSGNSENMSVRQVVDSVCQVAQLCCYLDSNGDLRFASVRPLEFLGEASGALTTKKEAWRITPRHTYSALYANLILTNQIDSVSVAVRQSNGEYMTKAIVPAEAPLESNQHYKQTDNNPFLSYNCSLEHPVEQSTSTTGIEQVIANNIYADYESGVRAGDAELAVLDMTDTLNNTPAQKIADNGELLGLGDVVTFDKDSQGTPDDVFRKNRAVYWEVRGRTLNYGGTPKLQLQLQELNYYTVEYLGDTAPIIQASVYSGSRYFKTYATVSWSAPTNIKDSADVAYDLYVNNSFYKTYYAPQSVEIESPKGVTLNFLVRAYDRNGVYLSMTSNTVSATIPTLLTYQVDYKLVAFPDDRRIVIHPISDADSYTLRAQYEASNSSTGAWQTIATYSKLSQDTEYVISLPSWDSAIATFQVTAHNNQFGMDVQASTIAATRYLQTNFTMAAQTPNIYNSTQMVTAQDIHSVANNHSVFSNGMEPVMRISANILYGFGTATRQVFKGGDIMSSSVTSDIISYPSAKFTQSWTDNTGRVHGELEVSISSIAWGNNASKNEFPLKFLLSVGVQDTAGVGQQYGADVSVGMNVYYIGRR